MDTYHHGSEQDSSYWDHLLIPCAGFLHHSLPRRLLRRRNRKSQRMRSACRWSRLSWYFTSQKSVWKCRKDRNRPWIPKSHPSKSTIWSICSYTSMWYSACLFHCGTVHGDSTDFPSSGGDQRFPGFHGRGHCVWAPQESKKSTVIPIFFSNCSGEVWQTAWAP